MPTNADTLPAFADILAAPCHPIRLSLSLSLAAIADILPAIAVALEQA